MRVPDDDKLDPAAAATMGTREKTSESDISGPVAAKNETRAPEEENESDLDADPRPPSEMQPPTSEGY